MNIFWKIALYIRLSREDGREESLSVKNQRQILMKYLETFGDDYILTDSYTDDGYTGTDSDRKDFQRLLADIETKRVNCVIVKDLSRLSRNYIEAGYYLENYFVNHNIRFISLELPALDSYKHPEFMNSLIVPIQNIINDDFCRQTSVKIRGVLNVKRSNGDFIGAFAPYGYKKNPNDRHKLIIDEEAAQTVKNIYSWFIGGMSKRSIAVKLTSLGVPTPSEYKRQKGFKYSNSQNKYDKPAWSPGTIKEILNNKVYLGHMIQGKFRVKSYKIHKSIRLPENEWFVSENTHEPLISQKVFDKAQKIQSRNTRTAPAQNNLHLFAGFVRCADCGRTMHRKSSKNIAYFYCRQYADTKKCTKHSVREHVLEKLILESIDLSKIPKKTIQSGYLDSILEKHNNEIQKTLKISDLLYIDWKNGDITQDEYKRMKLNFFEKTELLKNSVAEIEKERKKTVPEQSATITREILAELIDVILVHENKKVTIKWK